MITIAEQNAQPDDEHQWCGSPTKEAPDTWWEDDDTGEYVKASTGERMSAEEGRRRICTEKSLLNKGAELATTEQDTQLTEAREYLEQNDPAWLDAINRLGYVICPSTYSSNSWQWYNQNRLDHCEGKNHSSPLEAMADAYDDAIAWELENALVGAIESSGFSVSGPTDVRVVEHGEPVWVCNARAALAKAYGANVLVSADSIGALDYNPQQYQEPVGRAPSRLKR